MNKPSMVTCLTYLASFIKLNSNEQTLGGPFLTAQCWLA